METFETPIFLEPIDQIQRDLACPNCEYNLRGLHGDVVICPECGATCDRAELVARKWTKPWHKAPKMTQLSLPVAWLYLGLIALAIWAGTQGGLEPAQALMGWSGLIAGWMLLLVRAWFVFERTESVGLALLAHAVLGAYLVALASMGMFFYASAYDHPGHLEIFGIELPQLAWIVIFMATITAGIWLGRAGEYFIAMRCIRQHLRKPPTS